MTSWEPRAEELERARTNTLEMRSSDRPHWREVREKLLQERVAPEDAVLADWENEGPNVDCGAIATRTEEVFSFCVRFGYDRDRNVTAPDVGWVQYWRKVAPEEIGPGEGGRPNSWLIDLNIARIILESEESGS